MGEEEGLHPLPPPSLAGVFVPSEAVSQYICIKLPKTNDNDTAEKNDVNTLSWHMADAFFHASAS